MLASALSISNLVSRGLRLTRYGYVIALGSVAAFVLVRYGLDVLGGDANVLFLVPVAIAGVLGARFGAVAAAFAAVAETFFFLPPIHSLAIERPEDRWGLVARTVVGLTIVLLISALRRSSKSVATELPPRQKRIIDGLPALLAYAPRGAGSAGTPGLGDDWTAIATSDGAPDRRLRELLSGPVASEQRLREAWGGQPRVAHRTVVGPDGERRQTQVFFLPHRRGDAVEGLYLLELDAAPTDPPDVAQVCARHDALVEIVARLPDAALLVRADGAVAVASAAARPFIGPDARAEWLARFVPTLDGDVSRDGHDRVGARPDTLVEDATIDHADGSAHPVRITAVPMQVGASSVVLLLIRDRSEEVRLDHARVEAELAAQQSEKMSTVGRLAAGLAHDINNILAVIMAFAHLATRNQGDANACMEEITVAGTRGRALTSQLLAFVRKQPMQPRPVDVAETLDQVGGLLRCLIGRQIKLSLVNGPSLDPVMLVPGQLEQVLMNLLANARDSMGDAGGAISVTAENVLIDEDFARARPDMRAGPHVKVRVVDSGAGMDEATLERLFRAPFTTKSTGTGLGLTIVRQIVHQAHGNIDVRSSPGNGTTFDVYLPSVITRPTSRAALRDR